MSGLTGPSIPAAYAAFSAPGALSFGTDGDREISLDLRAHAGLGLIGPRAADTARALLVGILANGGPLPSLDHMRVLICAGDLATLMDGVAPAVPRLEIAADLDEAVDTLEAEYLDRRRTLAELGVRDAASVRRFYAEQTLEPLVLIATPDAAATPRLAALLDAGRTADVHAVLLGPWETGTTADIDASGRTISNNATVHGTKAFALSAAEATALLAQLATATATEAPHQGSPTPVELDDPHAELDVVAQGDAPRLAAVPAQHIQITELPLAPRVTVNVLGTFALTADGRELAPPPMDTSILTLLALRPGGATRDAIIETLWTNPDGNNNGSAETFRSTVYNVRDRIRAATGETKKMYIAYRGSRYLLDPAEITTDIARFTQALTLANRTRDDAERIASLEKAVDAYRGHLADGIIADWLIVDREAESRRFGDACVRLSELTVDTRPEFALHVLERAVADADANQELYAKIMRIQARLGRHAEMWKTLRLLEIRLAAIQDQPDRDLYDLAEKLMTRKAG